MPRGKSTCSFAFQVRAMSRKQPTNGTTQSILCNCLLGNVVRSECSAILRRHLVALEVTTPSVLSISLSNIPASLMVSISRTLVFTLSSISTSGNPDLVFCGLGFFGWLTNLDRCVFGLLRPRRLNPFADRIRLFDNDAVGHRRPVASRRSSRPQLYQVRLRFLQSHLCSQS